MHLLEQILGVAAFHLIAIGLAQYLVSVVVGGRETERAGERDTVLAALDEADGPELPQLTTAYLIPCLNEALVIGDTVKALLAEDPKAIIIVIDDGSTDGTALAARRAGGRDVSICRRALPNAQEGKGPALNAGLAHLEGIVANRNLSRDSVVVGVMDADGRLSPGAADTVRRLFHRSEVGAVQLPVRIRNTGTVLTDYQDFEFWGLSAVQQAARSSTGTVSLGGNGQFSRLVALDSVGAEPWSESLTEDLDLAISMMVNGWELEMSPTAWVDQQAVTELPRLLRQRTRWMQGHLVCSGRIGEIWRSGRLGGGALLEVTNYLMVPIMLILPWSIVFTLSLGVTARLLVSPPDLEVLGSARLAHLLLLGAWYLSSFAPHLIAGRLYSMRRADISRRRALLLAHGFVLYNFVTFVATWRAVGRILTGRTGWTKTTRTDESADTSPAGATA